MEKISQAGVFVGTLCNGTYLSRISASEALFVTDGTVCFKNEVQHVLPTTVKQSVSIKSIVNDNADPLKPAEPQNFVAVPASSTQMQPSDTGQSNSFESDDSEFKPFDPQNVSAEKVAGSIFVGIVGVAAIVGAVVLYFSVGAGWIFLSCLAVGLLLFGFLCYYAFFWPSVEHRHRWWRLTEVGLEVRRGVWWKHTHAIPWARVQHADVSQGPLQRMYGVGTLTVHTAGTSNSSVNLGGLSHDVAIEIRDEIIRQRAAGDVV